jgi:hypothetical protein
MGGGGEPWKGDVISGGGDGSGNGGEGPMGHWGKLGGTREIR